MPQQTVCGEVVRCLVTQGSFDAIACTLDGAECRTSQSRHEKTRSADASNRLRGRGVEAVAGGNIYGDAEALLQQLLYADQFDQGEPAVPIVIDEKTKVATWLHVIARRRAEQVQRRGPDRFHGIDLFP